MSIRTLLEVNHDYIRMLQDEAFLPALRRYLGSASPEAADYLDCFGIRVLGMRHHSGKFILDGVPDGFPISYNLDAGASPVIAQTPPRSLREAIGGLVSMCADAKDVFPDDAATFAAFTETINEIYSCIEDGVFGDVR